ncbi:MAG: VWA domain-containing protein [Deltaproteobacteria bacterium]|nr:VWA domain-containing protein [Deltaproteobacteria bacterium]
MSKNRCSRLIFSLFSTVSIALIGCSAGTNQTKIADGVAGAGGKESASGEAGSSEAGSSGLSGAGAAGGGNPLGEAGKEESFDPKDICAGKKVDPVPVEIEVEVEIPYEVKEPAPIAIYLMVDRSLSMNDPSGDSTKWEIVKESVEAFLNDQESAFLDVGIQYFPLDTDACDGVVYATPAVPVGRLPDNAGAITTSISSVERESLTPIEPALRGMTAFCAEFQAQNPEEKCVGVLISDGAPTYCSREASVLVGVARDAWDNSKVKTFAVGMEGADFSLLDQIAEFGGTDCTPDDSSDGFACDVSSGMTLIQAFEAIRTSITRIETRTETTIKIETKIADCEWGLPDTPETIAGEGEEFNQDKVNVVFYDPSKGEETIKKVPPGVDCDSVSGGWHYDDEDAPTKIVACPQTCDYITSVKGATIDIQLGCDTIVILR